MIDENSLIEEITAFGERMTKNGMQGDFHLKIIKAVTDIIAKHPKVDKWIPCSERSPEIGTCVLVTTESGCVSDDVLIYDYKASYSKEPCFHRWDEDMWNCYMPRVIAWMPLPEPYRKDVE